MNINQFIGEEALKLEKEMKLKKSTTTTNNIKKR